jgi:two-component system, chemotaxis family, sensor kinase Cph1
MPGLHCKRMKNKIKNNTNFCGSIPLNVINFIQPYGFLMVLEKPSMIVVQVSENLKVLFKNEVDDFLNLDLQIILSPISYQKFINQVNKLSSSLEKDNLPFSIQMKVNGVEKSFSCLLYEFEGYILLELELSQEQNSEELTPLYFDLKHTLANMQQSGSPEAFLQTAVEELKKLSGFDKVMIYQFDDNWNGSVVAEACEDGMEAYLGLYFPASDIPPQARELYVSNPYRMIPDVTASPVKLIPVVNPVTNSFTDLTPSNLRGVARVHVEYLQNMQVKASMSFPIIIDNKLWGLISFHHRTPKLAGQEMRAVIGVFSNIFSMHLAGMKRETRLLHLMKLNEINVRLIEQLYQKPNFIDSLLEYSPGVKEVLGCQGVALVLNGQVFSNGVCPAEEMIKYLVRWLQREKVERVYTNNSIHNIFSQVEGFDENVSGVIALSVVPQRGEFLLGFRPEIVQTVRWGGNPEEALTFEPDGKTYHPRNSFATWKQTVRGNSRPWGFSELRAAENLRVAILERVLKERSR